MLEAGLDKMVRSDGIEHLRRTVPNAKYRLFPGAYHDLFDETDDIRRANYRQGMDSLYAVVPVRACRVIRSKVRKKGPDFLLRVCEERRTKTKTQKQRY